MKFSGLFLLAVILLPATATAEVTIRSAETGYTVTFPVQPKEQLRNNPGLKLTTNVVRDGDNIFVVTEGLFDSDIPDPKGELEADVASYIKAFEEGKLISEQNADFVTRAGTALPARQFSFDGKAVAGRGLVVVSGRRAILVAATRVKPNGTDGPNDKFLSSFRIEK